ncbi:hypothetical protein A2U01_0113306, partial [Trifolium medium]|nr:hypothetical protein [Trifolium medium]
MASFNAYAPASAGGGVPLNHIVLAFVKIP